MKTRGGRGSEWRGCGVWAVGAARWPRGLGMCVCECVHTSVWASGGLGPARAALSVRCAREAGECAGGVCVCVQPGQRRRLEPQGGAWARGSLCPRVCARAPPPSVPGADSCPGDAALVRPWSPPPRCFPEPSTLPSPPPCLASAQRSGAAPGFLESPAGRWRTLEAPRPVHRV